MVFLPFLSKLVRCLSGRKSKPGKFVYGQPYRGFESHLHRKKGLNTKKSIQSLCHFIQIC